MKRTGFTLLAALVFFLAAPLHAQRITGQISGTVEDDTGGVLPGVTVSLTGETIVGTQTVITNASGFYRFVNLRPGLYNVNFSLDGFAPENISDVRVSVGSTTTEDATLKVGSIDETINVISEAAVIDTSSNEVGTNFGRDWVENAPMQRLSFSDLVAAAPGSLRAGDQSGRTMVYGSSYDENSFQLDGVDINDNFFNEQLAEPNIDAIEEIEVLSLGAPAEYGNLTGAVYNIVTRQGGNQFHGDLNVFFQSDSLTEENTDDDEDFGFPFKRDEYNDYTAQIGGPISRDKVWFFASFQRQEDGASQVGVDPELGTTTDEVDRLFVKLNFFLNSSHSLVASFHQDEPVTPFALAIDEAPSVQVTRVGETPTPNLGYTGILSDSTFVDARFSGFYGDVTLGPTDTNQPRDLARILDLDIGFISGGHYYWYDLQPKRTTVNAKVSHLADDFVSSGDHEFRFGVQYNTSEAGGIYGYNDLILAYSYAGTRYGYGYTRAPFSYSGNADGIGVFVDDNWRVNDKLTLNLGVRFDSNEAFAKGQQELDENANPTGASFPETTLYTWDYISPRFGFNVQLTDDGRTVLKGHFGRYHRAITTGEFANVIGPSIKPIFAGPYDLDTGQFLDLFQISDNSSLGVDPDYDSPRTDQFILSFERQLAGNIGLNLNLVHKRGRDMPAWQDVGGIYEDVVWIDGDFDLDGVVDVDAGGNQVDPFATGDPITVQRLVNSPSDLSFLITNRPEMDQDIYAASLGVVKPMRNNWSLSGSITWLESEGRTTDSGGGASLAQRGGLQFRGFGRNPNDFVNSGGRLRGDTPLQVKAQFVYRAPKDITLAANLSHRSGGNKVRRVRLPRSLTTLNSTILAQERGTFGRLEELTNVDLRIQKDFILSDGIRLGLIADVFNVLNDGNAETVRSTIATSSVFLDPTGFVLPRRVMLGAKLRF